jgi:hypothetical protein
MTLLKKYLHWQNFMAKMAATLIVAAFTLAPWAILVLIYWYFAQGTKGNAATIGSCRHFAKTM